VETATINIFKNAETSERFTAGDVIFSAGDPGDSFYVVREGTVTLSAGGRKLEDVGPGGIFGELGVLERAPRSATAIAATDCDLVQLDERSFIFHVSQTPFFALTVMRVLAERLRRETNGRDAAGQNTADHNAADQASQTAA
jgi:CRP/FNR family transcriptional regulator, cyclic AMP receptor protein